MGKLFSISGRVFLKNIQNSEAQLNRFLSDNWEHFFPHYTFIKSEFPLNGIVRTSGRSGRIDILAFNPSSNKLVVFELKRDFSRNIRDQAGDYRDKIVSDFHKIYNDCIDEYDAKLPRPKVIIQDSIEIVLVSNSFSTADIEKVNNFKNDGITLIKYSWFENDLFLLEYLNNIPSEQSQKTLNEERTQAKQIQPVTSQKLNSSSKSTNVRRFNGKLNSKATDTQKVISLLKEGITGEAAIIKKIYGDGFAIGGAKKFNSENGENPRHQIHQIRVNLAKKLGIRLDELNKGTANAL